jgi:hypothetical protein
MGHRFLGPAALERFDLAPMDGRTGRPGDGRPGRRVRVGRPEDRGAKRVGMAFGFLSSLLVAGLAAVPLGVLPMEPSVKTFIGASLFLLITFVGLLLGYQYPTWFHPCASSNS